MTETSTASHVSVASVKSKKAAMNMKKIVSTKKAAASSKPKTHPPVSEMVNAAIAALKDRKGSSLQAIKKYIASTYKVDLKKQSIYIRKYLKSAVEKNTIVQAKGTGASGRFKLAAVEGKSDKGVKKQVAKKPATKKSTAEKKTAAKKPAAKKAIEEKKTAAKKPTATKKTAAKATKSSSPSKTKKTGKAPAAAKPKTPKPKKAPNAKTAKK